MTRAALFLVCTSMLVSVPVSSPVLAKTYRAPHGIAFQSARDEMRALKDVAPSSGEDSAVQDTSAQVPVADTGAAPMVISSPAVSVSACDAGQAEEEGEAYVYYPSAPARFEKTAGRIKIETSQGSLYYKGALYTLRGVEVLSSANDPNYPLQLRLWHEKEGGERVAIFVPVAQSDAGHAGFEFLLRANGETLFDPQSILPGNKAFKKLGKSCVANADVLMLSTPVSVSSGQVARFKSGI